MTIEPTPRKMAEQCAALMGGNGLSTEQSIKEMESLFLKWNRVILSAEEVDSFVGKLDYASDYSRISETSGNAVVINFNDMTMEIAPQ